MTEQTTLANGVMAGAGYIHLARAVPTPCRITLSPDTSYAETVPAYLCTDDEPPVVMLGYGSASADRVVLTKAHSAGGPVRVEFADAPAPGDARPGLPPFSSRDGACPTCGTCRGAAKKRASSSACTSAAGHGYGRSR